VLFEYFFHREHRYIFHKFIRICVLLWFFPFNKIAYVNYCYCLNKQTKSDKRRKVENWN